MKVTIEKIAPQISINGNSINSLIGEWEEFYDALRDVVERFPLDTFHPRNQSGRTHSQMIEVLKAKKEMRIQINNLQKVAEEMIEELTK